MTDFMWGVVVGVLAYQLGILTEIMRASWERRVKTSFRTGLPPAYWRRMDR